MAKLKRLLNTYSIFELSLSQSRNILKAVNAQVNRNETILNKFQGRLLRASRQATLDKIKSDIEIYCKNSHSPTLKKNADKTYLLAKVGTLKAQNKFLLRSGVEQFIINICVSYDALLKRIMMKYYEENIERIPNEQQAMKNSSIIEAIKRGDNMHYTLAHATVSRDMRGDVTVAHEVLKKRVLPNIELRPDALIELFLVRNSLVHNNRKVSSQLHQINPKRYPHGKIIHVRPVNAEMFGDAVHKTGLWIINEYVRLNPKKRGTWLKS